MIEVERVVRTSPREIFDVLGDGWSYAAWVVGASRIRAVDQDFPQPGTRIHHSVGSWPVLLHDTTHVVSCVPNERIVLRARGWPLGEADVELHMEPLGNRATKVRMLEDVSAGPGRLLPRPVRIAIIAPRNRETLRRLAYLAEHATHEDVGRR